MKRSISLFLFILILGLSSTAIAQVEGLYQTDININMVPENPKPLEKVHISLGSFGTDVNMANITWKVNGKTIKTGIGEKTFDFSMGDVNITTTLGITVETREGEIIERTLSLRPTSVDLIWQSESFTPPFYKGKALFSHQSEITFIALPHITSVGSSEFSAKNLVYKWKKNGSVVESASGFGKNTYTLTGSLISRPIEVTVEVTTPNTNDFGIESVTVNPIDPFIIFYSKSPVYGIEFQRALQGTVGLTDSKELNVFAVPFFFGVKDPESYELNYKWAINGSPIMSGGQTEQIFRQKEGTFGTSNISLSVENESKILQYTKNQFNLSFGE